jgi:pyruvate kinase
VEWSCAGGCDVPDLPGGRGVVGLRVHLQGDYEVRAVAHESVGEFGLFAVRIANKVRASLIIVLTRGGSTARLVAKYRPSVPILSVAVPVMTTDSLTWTCSEPAPAHHSLVCRGLIPLLAEGSAKATDSESTDEILKTAIGYVLKRKLCLVGDSIVALHRIGVA